jgi:uncharacterized YigZ family protein
MTDWYFTIQGEGTGAYQDRGSRFLAYAFAVSSEEQVHQCLQEVRNAHPKARHHCYAYRLGADGRQYRAQDDGEPGGTAGRPILGQLDRRELRNALVVVVRYFGGTLLGTGGLIQAYREAASRALDAVPVVKAFLRSEFAIRASYAYAGELMDVLRRLDFEVLEQSFSESAHFQVAVRRSLADQKLVELKAVLAGVSTEEAQTMGDLPGLDIQATEASKK